MKAGLEGQPEEVMAGAMEVEEAKLKREVLIHSS